MHINLEELKDQIEETAQTLNLEVGAVEKDVHVTKVIHTLADIDNKYYQLIFQGGTSLAKAHQIIPRMSEDVDYRVQSKEAASNLGRYARRKHLRDFRQEIIERIQKAGFSLVEDARVFYEGEYMQLKLKYDSIFDQKYDQKNDEKNVQNIGSSLKPFVAIDFFVSNVRMPSTDHAVTTLIRQTLGPGVDHPIKDIKCLDVIETAAEKWVGVTRRIATAKFRQYYNDPTLIRHLYDLYNIQLKYNLGEGFEEKIHEKTLEKNNGKLIKNFGEIFSELTKDIIISERKKFKIHNLEYSNDPLGEIKRASLELHKPEWKQSWDNFINDMVFDSSSPSYDEVLNKFLKLSERNIQYLEKAFQDNTSQIKENTQDKMTQDKMHAKDLNRTVIDDLELNKVNEEVGLEQESGHRYFDIDSSKLGYEGNNKALDEQNSDAISIDKPEYEIER